MSAQHTPGRLKVQHPHAGDRGWEVAFEPGLEQVCQNVSEANARRLVACWNACEGIETYALELMTGDLSIREQISVAGKAKKPPSKRAVVYRRQRDELLAALKRIEGAAHSMYPSCFDMLEDCQDIARAAIAKAEAAQ